MQTGAPPAAHAPRQSTAAKDGGGHPPAAGGLATTVDPPRRSAAPRCPRRPGWSSRPAGSSRSSLPRSMRQHSRTRLPSDRLSDLIPPPPPHSPHFREQSAPNLAPPLL